jgi:hypothetical protein
VTIKTPATTNVLLKRIFTDTDMHDPFFRDEIEEFYQYLQKMLRVDQLKILSNNYDLVLDIVPIGGRIQWSYYYAHHGTRCLFWLQNYDATNVLSELWGVNSPAHISELQLSYSNHPLCLLT